MRELLHRFAAMPPERRAGGLILFGLLPAALLQNLLLAETTRGHFFDFRLAAILIEEVTSIGLIAALVPALGWWASRLQRRQIASWRWLGGHLFGLIAFSPLHVAGMILLRQLIFGWLGTRYRYGPLPWGLFGEFIKDAVTYALLLAVFTIFARRAAATPAAADRGAPQRLWVKTRDGRRRVELAEIRRVEAAGNYVSLVLADATLLHRATMAEMLKLLPADRFHRVHRSHIVNRATVRAIAGAGNGERDLVLADGSRVPLGRRYAATLETLLQD